MTERPPYDEALRRTGVLHRLAGFDPQVVGTLPLGLAVPRSDIDIVCHAPDSFVFAQSIWGHFCERPAFALHQWSATERPVVARFEAEGWAFEIFGAIRPVRLQAGWRHFEAERRLLALGGEALRSAVLALRREGAKTEPAFASLLGLAGDPYAAMLELHDRPEAVLTALLARAGFRAA